MSSKKFIIKTLGCKANFSDGQAIEAGLIARGLLPATDAAEASLVVVNSCTVTDEADRQSRKMVRDLKRASPNARIVYTGCGAEVNPGESLGVSGVSAVLGNQNKATAAELIFNHLESGSDQPEILGGVRDYGELLSRHPMDREWPLPEEGAIEHPELPREGSTYRTRAFLKIQEGCDSFCTYCIIPYGRGPARSLSIDTVLERVRALVQSGVKEVVLTGTNIGDYGLDWSGGLQIDDLLERILTSTGVERLRIGSLDPTEISPRMMDLVDRHESFCPHFHVSLQHTESRILKLMKRKYSTLDVESFFERALRMRRKPFLGMDLITGFPGETDEDFIRMKDRLEALEWNRIHVFPYSERSGTPATRLSGVVPPAIRKSRARSLQELSLNRLTRLHAGRRDGVLSGVLLEGAVLGPDGTRNWISGYTPDYQRVLLSLKGRDGESLRNQVVVAGVRNWIVDRPSGEVSWIGEVQDA